MNVEVVGEIALMVIGSILVSILFPGVPKTLGDLLNREIEISVKNWARKTRVFVAIVGSIFFILGLILTILDQVRPNLLNPVVADTTTLPTLTLVHTLTPTTCMLPEVKLQTNISSRVTPGQQVVFIVEPIQEGVQYSWEVLLGTIDPNTGSAIYTAPVKVGNDVVTVQAGNVCGAKKATFSLEIIAPTATPTTTSQPITVATPTFTFVPTVIDTPTPMPAATDTPTAVPSPLPSPIPQPPRVMQAEMLPGGVLSLEWTWYRILEQDMRFAIRLWPVDQPDQKHSLVWTKEYNYVLSIDPKHFPEGDYYFNTAVVRDLGDGEWSLVVESEPVQVYVPYINGKNITDPVPTEPPP